MQQDLHQKLYDSWDASSVVFDNATQEDILLEEGARQTLYQLRRPCDFELGLFFVFCVCAGRQGLTRFLERMLSEQDPNYRFPWQQSFGPDDNRAVRMPTLLEHWFDIPLNELDVKLVGLFDRVDTIAPPDAPATAEDALRVIVDYKSHMGSKDALEMAQNSLQLKIYALAHSRLYGKLPDFAVIESIEDPKVGWKEVNDKDVAVAYSAIRSAANGIRQGDFTPNSSAFACRFCPHKDTCLYSAASSSSEPASRTVFSDV